MKLNLRECDECHKEKRIIIELNDWSTGEHVHKDFCSLDCHQVYLEKMKGNHEDHPSHG